MIYTIENEFLTASVSSVGAELQSLKRKADGDEYIWQGDPDVWSGHSPLLFPVVGRLKGDAFIYEGRKYDLGKHGFARKTKFEADQQSGSRLAMTLKSGAHKEMYPFDFTLEVCFELTGMQLKVTHRVMNEGRKEMFFSLGAHPGFNCGMGDWIEFPEDETAWAYKLDDETKLRTETKIEQGVSGHRLTVTEEIFAHDALIFEGLRSDSVSLFCGGKKRVTVDFGSAPCLGVWAKPGAKYVCIEPWHGVDDSASATGVLSGKKQIVKLAAGDCFRFPMTITAHK
ncbi:MAG: aldose 1-epimerase family protein [Clostridia bacterium]|nr:aldose 1-epimerase family protein [Clostridia bacterium]